MIELLGVAQRLQGICLRERWPFCFIGGIALQRWGEPRVTADVDAMVYGGYRDEQRIVGTLLREFAPRIPDAESFALARRVLLLTSDENIGLDIALGGLPFEALMVQRASNFEFLPGISIRTCSAEDLVVLKAFANRPRDWLDLEGILVRQADRLDWNYIEEQLPPLAAAKNAPEILVRLRQLRTDCEK